MDPLSFQKGPSDNEFEVWIPMFHRKVSFLELYRLSICREDSRHKLGCKTGSSINLYEKYSH